MAMKKKGAAKGGVRKMKAGSVVSKKERGLTQQEALRARARNASIKDMGKIDSPSAKKRRAAEAKANAAVLAKNARKIKTKNMSKGVGSGGDRYTQADDLYERIGREGYEKPSRVGGRPERKVNTGNMPKLKAGGAVAKKMAGGAMKKKGYAKGGKLAKMNPGGRLNMVKNKAGKMVPDFAADGKGKMAKGGAVAKKMGGGMMKKKGMAKGGKMAKMSKGGGTFARGSGAARPQRFRKNG